MFLLLAIPPVKTPDRNDLNRALWREIASVCEIEHKTFELFFPLSRRDL